MNQIAFIIFYSKSFGVQSFLSFSREFKHCNTITYDGYDWIMIDFDRTGFVTRRIKCPNGKALLRHLKRLPEISCIITLSIKERVKITWKPFLVRSCNEICRYATGVDIGFTFNPVHLYRKLLQYSQGRNYDVLSAWRREHGISKRRGR